MKLFNKVKAPLVFFLTTIFLFSLLSCRKRDRAIDVAKRGRQLFMRNKTYKEAVENFNEDVPEIDKINITKYNPGYDIVYGTPTTRFSRGSWEYLIGNYEAALDSFKKTLDEIKDYDETIPKLKTIKKGLPGVLYCYGFGLSFSAMQEKDLIYGDSAQAYLEKAIQEFKKIRFYYGLANCYEYQGDLNSKLANFNTARRNYKNVLDNIPRKKLLWKSRISEKISQTYKPGSDSFLIYKKRARELERKIKKRYINSKSCSFR